MNITVAGCMGCPLYDTTGSEYGKYCHHPNRAFKIGIYNNGIFTESKMTDDEKEAFKAEYDKQNSATYNEFWLEDEPIESPRNNNYEPVTPEWCPLKKEPITISIVC